MGEANVPSGEGSTGEVVCTFVRSFSAADWDLIYAPFQNRLYMQYSRIVSTLRCSKNAMLVVNTCKRVPNILYCSSPMAAAEATELTSVEEKWAHTGTLGSSDTYSRL